MTIPTEILAPSDPLRLTFCPACDYSLVGLPDAGICPECGRVFDQTYIVLRGEPFEDINNSLSLKGSVTKNSMVVSALILAMVLIAPRAVLVNPFYVVMYGFIFVELGLRWTAQFISLRRGQVLVWISPTGIGQESTLDGNLLVVKIRRWARIIYYTAVLIWFFTVGRGSSYTSILVIAILSVPALIRYMMNRNRVLTSTPSDGVRPRMFEWQNFDEITLEPTGVDRWNLRARTGRRFRYLVNLKFEMNPQSAGELRSRINQWAGLSTDGRRKSVRTGKSWARSFGLAIHRLLSKRAR